MAARDAAAGSLGKATSESSVLGGGILWLILWFWRLRTEAPSSIIGSVGFGVLVALASVAAAWIGIFLVRLLGAPARLYQGILTKNHEESEYLRTQMEQQAVKLLNLESQRPQLIAEVNQCFGGGMVAEHPNAFPIAFVPTVLNRGGAPSVARNWAVSAECGNEVHRAPLTVLNDKIRLGMQVAGKDISYSFSEEDSIFVKTATPLPAGGMQEGTLFAVFDPVDRAAFFRGVTFTVRFEDCHGKEGSVKQFVEGTPKTKTGVMFQPGVRPRIS